MAKHPLREAARGKMCMIQIFGVCNRSHETSVLCHLPGPGVGVKADDIHAAIGCNACHDAVDGRRSVMGCTPCEVKMLFLEGVIRTQKLWLKEGLM